jgi:hypothetical protein
MGGGGDLPGPGQEDGLITTQVSLCATAIHIVHQNSCGFLKELFESIK